MNGGNLFQEVAIDYFYSFELFLPLMDFDVSGKEEIKLQLFSQTESLQLIFFPLLWPWSLALVLT